MKQRIFMLLAFVVAAMTSMTLVSCGDDNDVVDIEDGKQEGNEETESFTVTNKELEGTWVHSADNYDNGSNYGNIDYISFSSTGKGQMANASDYFRNVESHEGTDDGAFELVCFTYTIEGNVINVYPESISGLSPFKIEVIDPVSSVLNIRMGLNVIQRTRSYKKHDNDWQWFTNSGPASDDLTKDLVGTYAVDNNKYHKLEVKRVNNYTLTVYDLRLDSECTGYLYWHDLYNDTDNAIHLWLDENKSTTSNSYYWSYGKLYSTSGSHYFSGSASKISDDNSDSSDDESNLERLCHTWKAATNDGTFELEFRFNGLVYEKFTDDGEVYYSDSEYSLSGSQLTLYPGIVFINGYGSNGNGKDGYIFDLSFSSDCKNMILKAGSKSVNFVRVD